MEDDAGGQGGQLPPQPSRPRNGRRTTPPGFAPTRTVLDFHKHFPTSEVCAAYLYAHRFPAGFVCPHCGTPGEPFCFANRPKVFRCRACRRDTSLTAGTILQDTRQPLLLWFHAAFLVTTHTPGMSAVQFQKLAGIKRYETAFNLLHKLRAGMVRPGRDSIGAEFPVELDEKWVGGATQGEGKGVHHKTLACAAIEVMPRTDPKWMGRDPKKLQGKHKGGHGRGVLAGRLRMAVVADRKADSLVPFVVENVAPGAVVRTDGWQGYNSLDGLGYRQERIVVRGNHAKTDAHLPMALMVFGNLDAWLLGTHHGVSSQHLQGYLNEFVFRFNRRFWGGSAFDAVLGLGMHGVGPTYAALYSGAWVHPGGVGGTEGAE